MDHLFFIHVFHKQTKYMHVKIVVHYSSVYVICKHFKLTKGTKRKLLLIKSQMKIGEQSKRQMSLKILKKIY